MFVSSHRSLRSLAPQRSVHGLAHSLRSLSRGTVEILEYVFTLLSRFSGTNAFLALTRNTPYHHQFARHLRFLLQLWGLNIKLEQKNNATERMKKKLGRLERQRHLKHHLTNDKQMK